MQNQSLNERLVYFGNAKYSFASKFLLDTNIFSSNQFLLATASFPAHYLNLSDICQMKLNKNESKSIYKR